MNDALVCVLNRQRAVRVDTRALQSFVVRLAAGLELKDCELSVGLISDSAIRTLNHRYRGYDKATDVLSFAGAGAYLGDILISAETAYNQARRSRTLDFPTNLRRLTLHGLLHLMGYDHETDKGEMRAIERRLRRRFQC